MNRTVFRALLVLISCFMYDTAVAGIDPVRGELTKRRAAMDVLHYDITWHPNLDQKYLKGEVLCTYVLKETTDSLQLDLHYIWQVNQVWLDGQPVSYTRVGSTIRVPAKSLTKGKHTWKVLYEGQPMVSKNQPWDAGFVWKKDTSGAAWVGVACEGEGASTWWPCKDHPSDEPEEGVTTTCYHSGDDLTFVGNGRLKEISKENGMVKTTWLVTYPINLYNVTFNLGKYAHISRKYQGAAGPLDLDFYVLAYNKEKAAKHFMQVDTMLAAFEKAFGPYPYYRDGYKLVETPYWGMEHQSCVAYGNGYRNNNYGFDFIMVHESGHEWWGNQLSAADHADLWLHESFCTYSELVYLEHILAGKPQKEDRVASYINAWRKTVGNASPMVGKYGVAFNDWPDNDIYHKGAMLIHTLRNMIGEKYWPPALYKYAMSTQGVPTTTESCINFWASVVEQIPASEKPKELTAAGVKAVMKYYVTTTYVPVVVVEKRAEGRWVARLEDVPPAFKLPIRWKSGTTTWLGTEWAEVKSGAEKPEALATWEIIRRSRQ